MTHTKIDWCDFTWNPVWGCLHNCPFCYARGIARRFGKQVANRDDFKPTWIQANFDRPMPRKPSRIFVNSMSDVAFWNPEWIVAVKERMAVHPEHLFLILTKGKQRNTWSANNVLFGGTSVDQTALDILPSDRDFVSVEPIFGPVSLGRSGLRWVIVGAETGNRKGKVIPEKQWIESIRLQCRELDVPLFEKHNLETVMGSALVREYPTVKNDNSSPV